MPEGIEAEYYRRGAAATIGRHVEAVDVPDVDYPRGGIGRAELVDALVGRQVVGARRLGKLVLLDIGDQGSDRGGGVTLGLRFGMTGRLIVDDIAVIDRLEYSSDRDDPAWDRFVLTFVEGGRLSIRDPRRLGSVELDPDESVLGIDMCSLTPGTLGGLTRVTSRPIKALLMDQARIAGLGNLLADESLWRASIHPLTPADELDRAAIRRLAHHIRRTVDVLTERGGSHLGDLQPARTDGSVCPRCGGSVERYAIGGRTTYACAQHQPIPGGPRRCTEPLDV